MPSETQRQTNSCYEIVHFDVSAVHTTTYFRYYICTEHLRQTHETFSKEPECVKMNSQQMRLKLNSNKYTITKLPVSVFNIGLLTFTGVNQESVCRPDTLVQMPRDPHTYLPSSITLVIRSCRNLLFSKLRH